MESAFSACENSHNVSSVALEKLSEKVTQMMRVRPALYTEGIELEWREQLWTILKLAICSGLQDISSFNYDHGILIILAHIPQPY